MHRLEFEHARSRLWAKLQSLTHRDETAGDREELEDALRLMEQHAMDDSYWSKQVEWLKGQVYGLPVFSRDPGKQQRVGYEPIMRHLENWSHSFKTAAPANPPVPPPEP